MKDDASGVQAGESVATGRREFLLGLLAAGAIYAAPVLIPLNEAQAKNHGNKGKGSKGKGPKGSKRYTRGNGRSSRGGKRYSSNSRRGSGGDWRHSGGGRRYSRGGRRYFQDNGRGGTDVTIPGTGIGVNIPGRP